MLIDTVPPCGNVSRWQCHIAQDGRDNFRGCQDGLCGECRYSVGGNAM